MRMVDIIEKKKRNYKLTAEEIAFFIGGYSTGSIPDYQAAALMMAIWFNGLDREETFILTREMANSGDRIDLSAIGGIKADKHGTGGVADTTTLVLAPLVAACGVPVAKMSGRGLGHTGGTLDKLESIPGLSIEMSIDKIISNVKKYGLAIAGQSGDLAPADKAMYALRDVTATVDSLSLIAASIMSKKLVSGSDVLVLDVKTGSGAFMQNLESSHELASIMVDIGNQAGMKTRAVVTDMNQPLGLAVGNSLEVIEAIKILQGMHGDSDLRNVALELGANMLLLADKCGSAEAGRRMLEQAITNGSGLRKLAEMINAQGGDERVVNDSSLLPKSNFVKEVTTNKSGYVSCIDAREIGRAAGILGASRQKKQDVIDPAVGLVMNCRLGDRIESGGALCTVHYNNRDKFDEAARVLNSCIIISDKPGDKVKLIYETIS